MRVFKEAYIENVTFEQCIKGGKKMYHWVSILINTS